MHVTEMIEMKKNIIWNLFWVFMKIGLFTFGGGYAMISVVEDNCVEKRKWITHDEMMNVTVIAESTPGPIAINCATFVGYQQGGILGALMATLGVVLPSFTIIFFISMFLDNFLEFTLIANAFQGIKIAVGFLILNAGISMMKKMRKKLLARIILAVSFLVMLLVNLYAIHFSSISLMLLSAAISLSVFMIQKESPQKGGETE